MSYPPIAGHGLIGDLQTAALVATDGTIDWFCCPRFDSPSVFAALLDENRGGRFSLGPTSPAVTTKQMYLPDTAILVTRHLSESGIAEVLDFMPIDQPTVASESRRVVRAVRGIRGEVSFEALIAPRFDYGRQDHKVEVDGQTGVFECGSSRLHLSSLAPLERDGDDIRSTFTVGAGEVSGFVLEWGATANPTGIGSGQVIRMYEETEAFWRRWLERSTYRGRWREAVERSAITLKLMTYAPSGALVAGADGGSARTSRRLPELGLPVHLGARWIVLRFRAARSRFHRGGGRIRRLAP